MSTTYSRRGDPYDGTTAPTGRVCLVAPGIVGREGDDRHTILLGPWCAEGPASRDYPETVPAYGRGDPTDSVVLDEVFDEVVRRAATALETFHGVATGSAYWKVMAGHVLSALIPVVDDLSRRLEHAVTTGGAAVIRGQRPSRVVATNRGAWFNLYTDAAFIGQVASGLAGAVDRGVTIELDEAPPVAVEARSQRESRRAQLDRALSLCTNRVADLACVRRNRGAWIHDVTGPNRWIASQRLGEWVLPTPHVHADWHATRWLPWDATTREPLASTFAAAAAEAEHRLAHLTLSVAHLALPWRFVEGWSPERDFADLRKFARRRLIVSSYPAEHRLSLLATGKALGAKLLFCQHGGNYGEGPMDWQERYERRAGDGFVSWGWDGHRVVSAPSARLARFVRAYRRARGRQTGTAAERPVKYFMHWSTDAPHGYGLGSYVRPEHFMSAHDVLAPMARSCPDVVVRKHPRAAPLDDADVARTVSVSYESSDVPSPDSIAGSALVVFDVFRSTGFLECLAVRHPTVIFLAALPAARDAVHARLIQDLQEARVLNVGHEAMAGFWQDCYPNLNAWWHNERVVAATESYRKRHALAQHDWVSPLIEAVRDWQDPPTRDLGRSRLAEGSR